MKQIIFLISAIFTLSSCINTDANNSFKSCPNITIPRASAYLTQKDTGFEDFQIQVSGYEGYCYFDTDIKSYKAVITPIFELSRLAPSKDCQVDFKFFTETLSGPPEYLGKWQHHQSASIGRNQKYIKFKGKTIEQRVPNENKETFKINLGLTQTAQEQIYNKKTFDIQFDYIEK